MKLLNEVFQKIVDSYIIKKNKKLYYYFFSIFKFLISGPIVLNFKKYKFYSYLRKKDLSRWMLRNLKEWDKDNILTILNLIKSNEYTFIDCGCNYGAYSIPIAKTRPEINVYAFDASKKIIARLEENINLNNISNINIFNFGIADKIDYINFDDNLRNFKNSGSYRFVNKARNNLNRVKVYSLDELVNENKIELTKNIIIKLDIEGFEFKALRGMVKILENNNVFILFEFSKMLLENEEDFKNRFEKFIFENKLQLYDLKFNKIRSTKLFEILSKTDTRYQTIGDYILTKSQNEKN